MRECIKCRFCSPVGHGLALPQPWAKYIAAHHGATISSPSVRAADKRFGYRRHKVPISSTLGVDFVAALPRFRFPIQPWLSVAHSLEKLISTRHWNNDILSAFGRYQPAADDILALPGTDRGHKMAEYNLPVPELSDTGRKCYSIVNCRLSIVNYFWRRRRAARPISASRLSVAVVGSGMRSTLYISWPSTISPQ